MAPSSQEDLRQQIAVLTEWKDGHEVLCAERHRTILKNQDTHTAELVDMRKFTSKRLDLLIFAMIVFAAVSVFGADRTAAFVDRVLGRIPTSSAAVTGQ